MLEMFKKVLTNVLTALYQPFWFSVLLSVLFMFFLLYAREHGWKNAVKIWIGQFKTSSCFRRMLLLAFFTAMILFRTLLNRSVWENPLSDVMGGWGFYSSSGELTTEPIENLILMVPFTSLLLWAASANEGLSRKLLKNRKLITLLWQSLKIGFLFSAAIECLQLLFRLGTWQLSDICYNTIGGGIGGFVYWVAQKVQHRRKETAL